MKDVSAHLFSAKVMHHRHLPTENTFTYSISMICLSLKRVNSIQVPFLGINRFNLFSFYQKDHGAQDGSELLPWIREILTQHQCPCDDGDVILLTQPRFLGYVFNPVSFWYCYDKEEMLRAVLCEVNNTFGERHLYLVSHPDRSPLDEEALLHKQKTFHVSPFFPVKGEYVFQFKAQNETRVIAIDLFMNNQKMLTTRLSGKTIPLTTSNLLKAFFRTPLMTFSVIGRIHWQALRLFIKRVPFFKKPLPPKEILS